MAIRSGALSEEIVVDSDSSEGEKVVKKSKSNGTPKKKATSNDESSSKNKNKRKALAIDGTPSKKTKLSETPASKSASSKSTSTTKPNGKAAGSNSNGASATKAITHDKAAERKPKPNAREVPVAPDSDQTDSDATSETGSDSEPLASPPSAQRTSSQTVPSQMADTESSSEEEDSDGSSSMTDEPERSKPKKQNGASHLSSIPAVVRSTPQPSHSFEPPSGFTAIDLLHTKAVAHSVLSDMKGKQLWYITAPAGIEISQIDPVLPEDVSKGKAVLEHSGARYGFVQGADSVEKLNVPFAPSQDSSSKTGAIRYVPVRPHVDRVLHLQRIITPPDLDRRDASLQKEKPVRQQPEGLRMRWWPPGFEGGSSAGAAPNAKPVIDASATPTKKTIVANAASTATPPLPRSALKQKGAESKKASVTWSSPATARAAPAQQDSSSEVSSSEEESSDEDDSSSDEEPQGIKTAAIPHASKQTTVGIKAKVPDEDDSSSETSDSSEEDESD